MAKVKHTIKCSICGHVYDVQVCTLSDQGKVWEEMLMKMGSWAFAGKKCPDCKSLIKTGLEDNTIELDIEDVL